MTGRDDTGRGEDTRSSPRERADGDEDDYDPFVHVPERIDQVTASGLVQLHDALNERNRAKLRSVPIEHQAALLWKLVERGTIGLAIGRGERK